MLTPHRLASTCGPILAVVIALLAGHSAPAAVITWGSATNISDDSDVVTTGTLVTAVNLGSSSATTINGVNFLGTLTSLNTSSSLAPFTSLSSDYQTLVGSAVIGTPINLVLAGLTIGQTYLVQIWVNDSREVGGLYSVEATSGNSVVLDPNTSGAEGGLGQFVIGTFVADSSFQSIEFNPYDTEIEAFALINGVQLRQLPAADVPEPTTLACLGLTTIAGVLHGRRRREQPAAA